MLLLVEYLLLGTRSCAAILIATHVLTGLAGEVNGERRCGSTEFLQIFKLTGGTIPFTSDERSIHPEQAL